MATRTNREPTDDSLERFSTKGRSSPKRDRSKRLLDLVMLLLQSRIPVTFREIRDQFVDYQTANAEAGLRAFERDKADLLELGVPIRYVTPEEDDSLEEGGYVVELKSYVLPEVRLTNDEVSALYIASSVAHAAPGGSYPKIVDLALKKLAFDLPDVSDTPSMFPPAGAEDKRQPVLFHFPEENTDAKTKRKRGDRFAQLEKSVRLRKRVTITYQSLSSSESAKRDVDPYGMVYQQGVWLLVGHCHLRKSVRAFRVDRISEIKIAPRPKSPDFERPEDFDIRGYVSRTPWTYESEAGETITLEFDQEATEVLREDFGRDAVFSDGAGGKRVTFVCKNLDFAVGRILEAKGHIRVVEGEQLKKRLTAELLAVREMYQ